MDSRHALEASEVENVEGEDLVHAVRYRDNCEPRIVSGLPANAVRLDEV